MQDQKKKITNKLSPDYMDSLEETAYSLENSLNDIRKAEREVARGEYVTLDQLREDLRKHSKWNTKTSRQK